MEIQIAGKIFYYKIKCYNISIVDFYSNWNNVMPNILQYANVLYNEKLLYFQNHGIYIVVIQQSVYSNICNCN